ncbi:hypothetical protein [Nocardia thailandica]|uniref:hypothetical protein n=1 Tax=Nocardia thailandica TaxID=257275 RepID=UPI000318DE1E|nr:hypothetical protein [Nocardia thailandica]
MSAADVRADGGRWVPSGAPETGAGGPMTDGRWTLAALGALSLLTAGLAARTAWRVLRRPA